MKSYKIISLTCLLLIALAGGNCKKILEEHPQSQIVPTIFNTEGGILGGVSGVYNDLRSIWGTEGFSMQTLGGVDETLEGASASSVDFFTYNPMNSADESGSYWNNAYQDINTLNGVLQYAKNLPADTIVNQCVAQAKFLRAFWYYHLVINWGDVPLHLTFITSPSTSDSRQPMADVYKQIIQDLTDASTTLQVQSPVNATSVAPFGGKAAAQGAALYLLGKAYLTRAWSSAAQQNDFSTAASIFTNLITNQAKYGFGLWQDYADAFGENAITRTNNDYGQESIFISDHSINTKYGQYAVGGAASGGNAQNLQPWFQIWNYPSTSGITSYKNGSGALINSGSNMMTRDVPNGRPFIRVRPNNSYVLGQAFDNTDRINDTRYDKTFQTVWIANTSGISIKVADANNSRGIGYTLNVGVDTAVWMPPFEVTGAPQFNGTLPFKGIIIPPSLQTNVYFPANKKFMDPSRAAANFNDPSTRPVILWRFSDVYLLAAEAYFKLGDNVNAAKYINVIRERAAYKPTNTTLQNSTAAAAMDITPAQVTLDFILDERTRELYGEGTRWWDLVRTGSLLSRVQKWNPVEAGAHLQGYMTLRPIPQSQIDAVTSGPTFPQNNGY